MLIHVLDLLHLGCLKFDSGLGAICCGRWVSWLSFLLLALQKMPGFLTYLGPLFIALVEVAV